jgi:hypothetical protein
MPRATFVGGDFPAPVSTQELIKQVNPGVRGWGHHYKRAHVRKKGDFGRGTEARCGHPMRQLKRATLDGRRLPGLMAEGAHRVGTARPRWRLSHPVRAPAHGRGNFARSWSRRADHRRCTGSEDNRNGSPLRKRRGLEEEDARRRREFRSRSEQTAHKNCQTRVTRVSNPLRLQNRGNETMSNIIMMHGSGGRDRTGDLRIMIPPL